MSSWGRSNNLGVTGSGLLIRSMIIKTVPSCRLRSLGCKISVKGRLVGSSCMWFFTRAAKEIETNKPVIFLKKMPDAQRIFVAFGTLESMYDAYPQL